MPHKVDDIPLPPAELAEADCTAVKKEIQHGWLRSSTDRVRMQNTETIK